MNTDRPPADMRNFTDQLQTLATATYSNGMLLPASYYIAAHTMLRAYARLVAVARQAPRTTEEMVRAAMTDRYYYDMVRTALNLPVQPRPFIHHGEYI